MKLEDILSPELYAQVQAAIDAHNAKEQDKTKQVHFVDLGEGGYVSTGKHKDKVTALEQQITALQEQMTTRDTDLSTLQAQLAAAQTDATKLTEAQSTIVSLQNQYNSDKASWEAKVKEQAYRFAVRERANKLKFSSPAAKRDFERQAIEKDFKVDGENLQGYDEFLTQYTSDNPGAILTDNPKPDPTPAPVPSIVAPSGSPAPAKRKTLSEWMKEKNANPDTVVKFD